MRIPHPCLLPIACLLALSGCQSNSGSTAKAPPRPGIDTTPEGPIAKVIQAAADGAAVSDSPGGYAVSFPAGTGRPGALFTLDSVSLAGRLGVALDVMNTSRHMVRVYADVNGDMWTRGYVALPPGTSSPLYVLTHLKTSAEWPAIAPSDAPGFPNMHGIPGGTMFLWTGPDASRMARTVRVFVVAPPEDASIRVSAIRPFGRAELPDAHGFMPFIDRFGQYSHKDWPGKVHTGSDLAANRVAEDADLAAHPGPPDVDRYGGWATGPQLAATGHFRVEKNGGKWWLVDPDGRLFWSDGIGVVGFDLSSTKVEGRENFFEDPAPRGDFLGRNLLEKYGAEWGNIARDRALTRLTSWGFNSMGGASDPEIIARKRVPYTVLLWTARHGEPPIDPDSPAWSAKMRQVLATAAAKIKDDPWCIGFFVDNEIHASTDPAWFERYYSQVSAAAKELMPATLYLGSRLDYHDWPDSAPYRKEVVRIAARYCDVVSFNFYKFTVDDVAMPEGVDRPAIIGEFHMGSLDRGLFHTGLRAVTGQAQRAEGYRLYVASALRNPAIVGAHWFQFYDESTTGRHDGENYQIGFLDICDTPYPETVEAARDIGYRKYEIRSGMKSP